MERPGVNSAKQRGVYRANKRIHCLVYQTVKMPDCFIIYLFNPTECGYINASLSGRSSLYADLPKTLSIHHQHYYIYGDQAYVLQPYVETAFPNPTDFWLTSRITNIRISFAHPLNGVMERWSSTSPRKIFRIFSWSSKVLRQYFTYLASFREFSRCVCVMEGSLHNCFRGLLPSPER